MSFLISFLVFGLGGSLTGQTYQAVPSPIPAQISLPVLTWDTAPLLLLPDQALEIPAARSRISLSPASGRILFPTSSLARIGNFNRPAAFRATRYAALLAPSREPKSTGQKHHNYAVAALNRFFDNAAHRAPDAVAIPEFSGLHARPLPSRAKAVSAKKAIRLSAAGISSLGVNSGQKLDKVDGGRPYQELQYSRKHGTQGDSGLLRFARRLFSPISRLVKAIKNRKDEAEDKRYWVVVQASTKFERTEIAEAGVSIEEVHPDRIEGICTLDSIRVLRAKGIPVKEYIPLSRFKPTDFPPADEAYHNYNEMEAELRKISEKYPQLVTLFSIGKSFQGREIWGVRLSLESHQESEKEKPGVVFMGTHHAREHISTEVPLLLAAHLAENREEPGIRHLLETREVYIIPMVNPDGVEYDIETGDYRWQRKNMNGAGVDLNRNYEYKWGGRGSSGDPGSQTYRGPEPFSEAETKAARDFINTHPNINILVSYHSYSKLILYPWGYKYDPIANETDRQIFEKIAETMAKWTGYRAEQSSDLYLVSGDTTDWAYGEKKIFAFTFELDPKSIWDGGFYPGPKIIEPCFRKNLKPALYLIELADDPSKVLNADRLSYKKR